MPRGIGFQPMIQTNQREGSFGKWESHGSVIREQSLARAGIVARRVIEENLRRRGKSGFRSIDVLS